jgi:hypothetical protein
MRRRNAYNPYLNTELDIDAPAMKRWKDLARNRYDLSLKYVTLYDT